MSEAVNEQRFVVETLVSEAQALSAQMSQLQGSVERFIAITGTVAGAGLTLGLFQKQHAILIAMPIVLFILSIYIVQIFTDIASAAGQRRFLEQTINESIGCGVFLWCKVGKEHSARKSPVLSTILSAMVLLTSVVAGIWASFHYLRGNAFGWTVRSANILVILYASYVTYQAGKEYFKADDKAFESAEATELRKRVRELAPDFDAHTVS